MIPLTFPAEISALLARAAVARELKVAPCHT